MITYLIQIILFQIAFLAVYDFFLSKETFYKYNRVYLLVTPIISFVLPLIKIPTLQKVVPEEVMFYLPEVILSPQRVIEQTTYYSENSINYISILFWSGVAFFTFIFSIKLIKIIRLIIRNDSVQKSFYRLVFLHKQSKAFSFFNFIFLGKDIPKEQQEDIIKHEMVHAKQKHSLDLLFFELLRIVLWYNPIIYFYQNRITLLHEYISDAEVVKTTQKETYFNKLLSQTFEVENISFVNQFYKHSLIKKRITMMTKNKSKQIKKAKYLLLLPMLVSMLVYTSCNVDEALNEKDIEIENLQKSIEDLKVKNQKQHELIAALKSNGDLLEKNYSLGDDVPYAIIEEVPVYPGCVGTRAEKAACLNMKIKKFTMKNFNAGLSKKLGLSKGAKKIWTIFRIDKEGNVVDVRARAPHPKLKEEAERVARMLPKMEPGKQRGKPVGMKYTLPISFVVE